MSNGKNFVINETGYVPEHIIKKMKAKKKEKDQKKGKVVKAR